MLNRMPRWMNVEEAFDTIDMNLNEDEKTMWMTDERIWAVADQIIDRCEKQTKSDGTVWVKTEQLEKLYSIAYNKLAK